MLIFIDDGGSAGYELQTVETPFGRVHYSQTAADDERVMVIYRSGDENPKSWAYAARALGGRRVIGVVRDGGVVRSSAPSNFIEFTEGRPTTFFETVGTGYVQQNPPFCPELRQAVLAGGVRESGNLLVVNDLPSPAVRRWWRGMGVSLISTESQPEGALCRELELCYSVLALPEGLTLAGVMPAILANLPEERGCGCDQTLAMAKRFGKLSEDWFESLTS